MSQTRGYFKVTSLLLLESSGLNPKAPARARQALLDSSVRLFWSLPWLLQPSDAWAATSLGAVGLWALESVEMPCSGTSKRTSV